MELPTDPGERRAQVREIILRNEHPPGEVEKLYDGWEKYYDQDLEQWGYHLDKHLDEFEDFVRIQKDARILDLAAGTGLVGGKLQARGYTNLDALDGSQGMLDKAKQKNVYKTLMHRMVGAEPIEGIQNDSYDCIICVGSLSTYVIRHESFEHLAAITKPGGYIYFLCSVEWLRDEKGQFEAAMRALQERGVWRWVLMKEPRDAYYMKDQPLVYAFRVLK